MNGRAPVVAVNGVHRLWDYEHGRWTDCCVGDVHVWACDHVTACQCGKATRELAKCAVCGK